MNLKEQLYVTTLARCENLSRAAEALFISQPALSMYISNLENYLGEKLFIRKDKKFIPTYLGEVYIEKALKMLELKEVFDEELDNVKNGIQGRISIGIHPRRSPFFLAPIISRFKEKYPKVKLVFYDKSYDELEDLYEDDKIDILLGTDDKARKDSITKVIYTERIVVMLPPEHPANQYAVKVENEKFLHLDLAHLKDEHFILQKPDQSIRKSSDIILKSANIKIKSFEEIGNMETCMQFVAEGLGVGFNRETFLQHMKYYKKVNSYIIGEPFHTSDLTVCYKKNIQTLEYAEYILRIIENQYANYSGS